MSTFTKQSMAGVNGALRKSGRTGMVTGVRNIYMNIMRATRASRGSAVTASFIDDQSDGGVATVTLDRAEAGVVDQTVDVQGFYAAIQSVSDGHQTGQGHALSESGLLVLTMLDAMESDLGTSAPLEVAP
jgi:hypothetical protein